MLPGVKPGECGGWAGGGLRTPGATSDEIDIVGGVLSEAPHCLHVPKLSMFSVLQAGQDVTITPAGQVLRPTILHPEWPNCKAEAVS